MLYTQRNKMTKPVRTERRIHMKTSLQKKSICTLLVSIIAINAAVMPAASYAEERITKEETVYVNLKADGTQEESIVSDWLRFDGKKTRTIQDKTDLENLEVVKGGAYGENTEGLYPLWQADGKDLYYQGKSNKKIPIEVKISYYLDGVELSPEEIAGKSGKATIKIKLFNNDTHTKMIGGKLVKLHTPFTAAIVMGLSNDVFSNVECEDGKIFSDGNNQMVVFLAMPGLKESLDWDNLSIDEIKDIDIQDEMVVTADVEEFELKNVGIVASPKLIDLSKIKSTNEFKQYRQDIDRIQKDQNIFKIIDPHKSIEDIYRNPTKTIGAQTLIEDIFDFYDLDKAIIDILPDYVTDKNISLYDKIHRDLREANLEYVMDNQVLREIPDRMTDANIEKSRGLITDYDEIKTFDMERFDKAVDLLNDYETIPEVADMVKHSLDLLDKLEEHQDELDTLDKLSDRSNEIFNLLDNLKSMGIQGKLDDKDIEVMLQALAAHRATQAAQELDSRLIEADGSILEQNKPKIIAIIEKAEVVGSISSDDAEVLKVAVGTGNVGDKSNPVHQAILAIIQAGASQQANVEIGSLQADMQSTFIRIKDIQNNLQDDLGYNYESEIRNAVDFAKDVMPDVRKLRADKDHCPDTVKNAKNLLRNEEDIHYFHYWANRIKEMKTDLDENEETVEILRDLLHEYDDPKIKHFKDRIPVLRDDMDEARPILKSLGDKLDEPIYDKSLHSSPKTMIMLKKMKEDLDKYRDVSEALRLATDDRTVQAARDIIEIIDRYDEQQKLQEAKNKIEDLDDILDRKDAIQELSENYSIFTQTGENMDSNVKFVFKTQEISKDECKTEKKPAEKRKKGFFQWLKGLVNRK